MYSLKLTSILSTFFLFNTQNKLDSIGERDPRWELRAHIPKSGFPGPNPLLNCMTKAT